MRNILLIALREIHQALLTRGFWLGILILPLMGLLVFGVILLFQSSGSVKYFVFIDQSGQYEDTVVNGLEREYQKDVMRSLQNYLQSNLSSAIDHTTPQSLEDIPVAILDEQQDITGAEVDQFITAGGHDAALQSVKHLLIDDAPEFELPRRIYQRVALPSTIPEDEDLGVISEKLRPYLNGDEKLVIDYGSIDLFAAILIPKRVDVSTHASPVPSLQNSSGNDVQYWSNNLADEILPDSIERILTDEIKRNAYLDEGIASDIYHRIDNQHIRIKNFNPSSDVGKEEVSLADRIHQWVPAGLTYLLWISLFGILNALLTSTIEEKSNRIIEVLLSSVTADELMLGKLAGVAMVGLIMVSTQILLTLGILFWFSGPEAEFVNQLLQVLVSSNLLPVFFGYFILGYIVYGGIFISIGGLCDTVTDAQSYLGPLMVIMMVPLFTMGLIPLDPHGTLAVVMSWFPLYTPFAMINRIAADPPMFEVVGTLVLLFVCSAVILWSTGKIFRMAILRTGQPPRIVELIKWLRGHENHEMNEPVDEPKDA